MKKNLLSSLLCMAVFTVSCAKTDSDNIKTSGFYADYQVRTQASNSSIAVCSASFRVEAGGTFIDLSSGDFVTCNGQSMSRSEVLGMVTYTANVAATVGGTYALVLTRAGESPYTANVTLPSAVVPTSPANGTSSSKGSALNFSWTPSANSSDAMLVSTVKVTGGDTKCPETSYFDDTAPENGVGSFSASQMSLGVNGTAGACAMKVVWERRRTGVMPTGLNGVINAIQEANVSITLN